MTNGKSKETRKDGYRKGERKKTLDETNKRNNDENVNYSNENDEDNTCCLECAEFILGITGEDEFNALRVSYGHM